MAEFLSLSFMKCSGCTRHAGLMLLLGLLVPLSSLAQSNSPASCFTMPFNQSVNLIQITPQTGWGFFYQSNSITIQTSNNAAINVYTLNGALVYSGAPTTLSNLAIGHYFVETYGDRAEFAVLPSNWPSLSTLGWSGGYQPDPSIEAVADFLQLGWVRGAFL